MKTLFPTFNWAFYFNSNITSQICFRNLNKIFPLMNESYTDILIGCYRDWIIRHQNSININVVVVFDINKDK